MWVFSTSSLVSLPSQGSISPSSCPGQAHSQASEQLPRTDLCSWECTEPSEPFSLLAGSVPCSSADNTPVHPHQGSEQDSGQHSHCFNPAQVTCMIDLSWAPCTPLEPHWGVLGAFPILKNAPWSGRERANNSRAAQLKAA